VWLAHRTDGTFRAEPGRLFRNVTAAGST